MKKIAKFGILVAIFIVAINYTKITYAADETENVTQLYFDGNNLDAEQTANIQKIEKFINLEKLEICNYRLENISFIKSLPNLKELKINNCELSDIQDLEGKINLRKLDLGSNQISDITAIKKLVNLEKLKLDKNQIVDITPISELAKLTGLDLSSNQITDVTALKDLQHLTLAGKEYQESILPVYLMKLINFEHLYLDDNNISDISQINEQILEFTSLQRQELSIKTNKKEIEFPKFFESDKCEFINCKLNNDGTKITIIDTTKDVGVKQLEGKFCQSILTIKYDIDKPTLMVIYSDTEDNNQSATVTVTSNEELRPVEGWNLAENKQKLVKEYFKNTTEKIKVCDIAGNETNLNIEVKNVNKPILNITYTTMKDMAVSKGQQIITEADKYVGKIPYVLQGDSLTEGIDCSHFVYRILQICGLYNGKYIRSTNWINVGEPVEDLEHAIAGDVIVWDGHVGFYDGYGRIVEAKGTKWGITHDRDAAKAIEKETFLGIRRFTGRQRVEVVLNPNDITSEDVKVTINSNKKIEPINGWELSKDGKTLTKKYSRNASEIITIKDFEGNEIQKNISITNIYK